MKRSEQKTLRKLEENKRGVCYYEAKIIFFKGRSEHGLVATKT